MASRLAPPILIDAYRRFRGAKRPSEPPLFEYLGARWPADDAGHGWDHQSVAETQRRQWADVVERAKGPGPLAGGHDPLPRHHAFHGNLLAFAYVLARAASSRRAISMLDWGCGLGQYAVYARGLFPDLMLEYTCREVPALVDRARQLLPNDTFWAEDAPALARRYDLVMASGSIQYIEDWAGTLTRLARVASSWVYVTRLHVLPSAPSYVVLQRPHAIGYMTEYPGWFLNRGELLAQAASAGLALEREFLVDEDVHVPGAPEQPQSRGYLFRVSDGAVGREAADQGTPDPGTADRGADH